MWVDENPDSSINVDLALSAGSHSLKVVAYDDSFTGSTATVPVNVTASGLTVAEMYLAHIFPSYSRSNTEHALAGSGIAFPPVDGPVLDRNIDHLMESGYLRAPSARQLRAHAG